MHASFAKPGPAVWISRCRALAAQFVPGDRAAVHGVGPSTMRSTRAQA